MVVERPTAVGQQASYRPWCASIGSVVILPKKIEQVTITVDKAVVICMHTHVDLPIILQSIKANQIAIGISADQSIMAVSSAE
jgi:hypothetical protein